MRGDPIEYEVPPENCNRCGLELDFTALCPDCDRCENCGVLGCNQECKAVEDWVLDDRY